MSDDAIRKALTGDRFNFSVESQVYALKYGMIRTMMEQGYEVMVDDTHTTETSIRRLLEINPCATFLLINTDVGECIERAIQTKQEDLVPVIRRLHYNLHVLIGLQPDMELPQDTDLVNAISYHVNFIRENVRKSTEYNKRV